jgi:hypothetical protein
MANLNGEVVDTANPVGWEEIPSYGGRGPKRNSEVLDLVFVELGTEV